MIRLKMPWPPSVNGYWRSVMLPGQRAPRQILSERGREYRGAAIAEVLSQCGGRFPPTITGRIAVVWEFHCAAHRAYDIGNFFKAAEDVLTHAKVWGDDSQVDRLECIRGEVWPHDPCVVVTITPIEPETVQKDLFAKRT